MLIVIRLRYCGLAVSLRCKVCFPFASILIRRFLFPFPTSAWLHLETAYYWSIWLYWPIRCLTHLPIEVRARSGSCLVFDNCRLMISLPVSVLVGISLERLSRGLRMPIRTSDYTFAVCRLSLCFQQNSTFCFCPSQVCFSAECHH